MSEDDQDDDLDPMEEAWFNGDAKAVEEAARAALAKDSRDAWALAWLGLAQYVLGQVPSGQASLRQAFTFLRARQAKAGSDEAKEELAWTMQTFADHLVDALAEDGGHQPGLATFILEGLELEHPPALRLQAEHHAETRGDVVGGTRLLKRALALDSTDAETHYLLARFLARLGKKPLALKHLGKAVEYGAGVAAVRELARYEPDFAALEGDAEFTALVETLPDDPLLRPLYEALDKGEAAPVLAQAPLLAEQAAQPLDVLYPWRDALELSLDSGEGDEAALARQLEAVQARIDALEDENAVSEAYSRFCGDA